jgi:hypothetical protein
MGMLDTSARSEEVRAILDGAADDIIDRIVETGASVAEITEAMHLLADQVTADELPSTSHVEEVREILLDAQGQRAEAGTSTSRMTW